MFGHYAPAQIHWAGANHHWSFRMFIKVFIGSAFVVLWCVSVKGARAQSYVEFVQLRNLTFGTVLAGTSKSVSPVNDTNSALFELKRHCAFLDLNCVAFKVTFTLPTQMTSGSNSIPISFGTQDAASSSQLLILPTANRHNPNAGEFTVGVLNILNSTSFVSLGGTVSPPSNAPAGSYTATIVITVRLGLL